MAPSGLGGSPCLLTAPTAAPHFLSSPAFLSQALAHLGPDLPECYSSLTCIANWPLASLLLPQKKSGWPSCLLTAASPRTGRSSVTAVERGVQVVGTKPVPWAPTSEGVGGPVEPRGAYGLILLQEVQDTEEDGRTQKGRQLVSVVGVSPP